MTIPSARSNRIGRVPSTKRVLSRFPTQKELRGVMAQDETAPGTGSTETPPPRHAATLILVRRYAGEAEPRLLMGKRVGKARFMPNALVFPGGAVDPEDEDAVALAKDALAPLCAKRLAIDPRPIPPAAAPSPEAMALAAIRETYEEAGIRIATPSAARAVQAELGASWRVFVEGAADARYAPRLSALRFIFRAITPKRRNKRFDARFFIADASAIHGDPDDFSAADGELTDLAWTPLAETLTPDTPFPTRLVIEEIATGALEDPDRPKPFLDHDADGAHPSFDGVVRAL